MSREWKPGEVGMVTDEFGSVRVAVRGGVNPRMKHNWHYDEAGIGRLSGDAIPLALINPENDEQIRRLLDLLAAMSFAAHACGAFTCLQAALREIANPKPPKPAEPTGLGAVVEDADGSFLTRARPGDPQPWVAEGGAWFAWDDIDVADVHSEGWS